MSAEYASPLCSQTSVSNVVTSGEANTSEPGGADDYAVDGNLSTYWVDRGANRHPELKFDESQLLCYGEIGWPYGDSRIWYFDISSGNNTEGKLRSYTQEIVVEILLSSKNTISQTNLLRNFGLL